MVGRKTVYTHHSDASNRKECENDQELQCGGGWALGTLPASKQQLWASLDWASPSPHDAKAGKATES